MRQPSFAQTPLAKRQVLQQGWCFCLGGLAIAIASFTPTAVLSQGSELTSDRAVLEEDQPRFAAEQRQLQLENNNLRLQETELELKRRILQLEQRQLGISDQTRAIGLDRAQAGTTFQELKTEPIESKILVFQSSKEVAEIIAQEIIEISKDSEIQSLVVYSQSEFAKVNGYRLYNSILKNLVKAYESEGIELEKLNDASGGGGTRGGLGEIAGGLQTSTTLLRSAADLLSYFRSEDVISPNSFTPTGQSFLVAQLVAALREQQSPIQVYAPSIYLMNFEISSNPIEAFLSELNQLALLKEKALSSMESGGNRTKLQRLQQLNLQADILLNLLKATDFQSDTSDPDRESGGDQIFQLIQGAQISQVLNNRSKRVAGSEAEAVPVALGGGKVARTPAQASGAIFCSLVASKTKGAPVAVGGSWVCRAFAEIGGAIAVSCCGSKAEGGMVAEAFARGG